MNKWVIIIGILIVVGLGFLGVSNMTGNMITGASGIEKVEDVYFKIGRDVGDSFEEGKLNEVEVENGEGRSE